MFGKKETKLMTLLRSKCYQAKSNFRKLLKDNLNCSLGCNKVETQYHIFEECQPVLRRTNINQSIQLDDIYGTLENQISIIRMLVQIDGAWKQLLEENMIP